MDPSNLKRGDFVRLANGDIESVVTLDLADDYIMVSLTDGKRYTYQRQYIRVTGSSGITEIINPAPSVNSRNTTPAIWPEPITDRQPSADDADADGDIQYLNAGGWFCREFDPDDDYEEGWQHTPMWEPRELDKRARTIQELQAVVDECTNVDLETLTAAIELLGERE